MKQLISLLAVLGFTLTSSATDLVCTLESGKVTTDGQVQEIPSGNYGTITIKDHDLTKASHVIVIEQPDREPVTGELEVGQADPILEDDIQTKALVWHSERTQDGTQYSTDGQIDIYSDGASFALQEKTVATKNGQTQSRIVLIKGPCQ